MYGQNDSSFIVKEGKPQAVIIISDEPASVVLRDRTTEYAAAFLRDHIEKVTGAVLPILKESEAPAEVDMFILVGDTRRGRSFGLSPLDLTPEGYRIKTVPGGVAILGEINDSGTDRGTLSGIYHFLEEVAGIRWYFATEESEEIGTVIPRQESLSINELDIMQHPNFAVRIGGIGHWNHDVARAWHPVLRFGSHKGLVANHTHERWPHFYGDSNPEYFGIRPDGTRALTDTRTSAGQNQSFLCLNEPGVLNRHVEMVDEYFRTGDRKPWSGGVGPAGNNIPFGVSDTRGYCHCAACKAEHTPERGFYGRAANLTFGFVKRYAEQVAEKHPQAVIWALAYDHHKLPPTNIAKLPENVGITLCLTPSITSQVYPAIDAENRKLIEDWFELVNRNPERLIIWDYFCYPNYFFLAPTEIPNLYKDMVNFIRDKSLGIFNNGFNPATYKNARLYLTYRTVWLMHRLLWDPDMDMEQARKDWCTDLFGPATTEMEAFYALLEDRWENATWEQRPFRVAVSERSVYHESYPPAVLNELESWLQKALAQTEAGTVYRTRLEWFADNAFRPFFQECKKHHLAAGDIPVHRPFLAANPPETEMTAFWQRIPLSLATDHKVTGAPGTDKTEIKVAYDKENLYIYARLESEAENKEDGNTPGTAETQMQTGEVGSVEKGDMFIIHLKPEAVDGYVELAVNPVSGAFSSHEDVMQKRGFNTTHTSVDWNADNVAIMTGVDGNARTISVALPWHDIPGINGVIPDRIRAQFIRWDKSYKHHFTCWVPTQSTWDYAVSRFGWLEFAARNGKSSLFHPVARQVGSVMSSGSKPEQPSNTTGTKTCEERKYFIVGQRDLNHRTWMEVRGILIFEIAELLENRHNMASATLYLDNINLVGQAPFDRLAIDHIVPVDAAAVTVEDYASEALMKSMAGIVAPAADATRRGLLNLDVTECVKADIKAGRSTSAFRIRTAEGCSHTDGAIRFQIFRFDGDYPRLQVEH